MAEDTSEVIKKEDWDRYQKAKSKLSEVRSDFANIQSQLDSANEIYKLIAELIITKYHIKNEDKISDDGIITRQK